jgi:hypothetical protein
VTPVADGRVPAAGGMRVDLALVALVVAHFFFLSVSLGSTGTRPGT